MEKMTKKEYKALLEKHKFFFSPEFTPKWLIESKVIIEEDFEEVVHILIDPEEPVDDLFKYRAYFDTPFYSKIRDFLLTKDCREFTFDFPKWIFDVQPVHRVDASINIQIKPCLNKVASWL